MSATVTITGNNDGLTYKFDSHYPSGNRISDASTILLNGTTTHGTSCSFYTKGYVYTLGARAAAYHSECGGAFKSQGNSVAYTSAWSTNQGVIDTTTLRHSNVGYQYKFLGYKTLANSYAGATTPQSNTKMYWSYWTKYNINPNKSWVVYAPSRTGSLSGGTDRGRGEIVTITLNDASTVTAYCCYDDGTYITFDYDHVSNTGTPTSTKLNGATILGLTSGNTATVDGTTVTPLLLSSTKWSRAMHGLTSSGARMWIIPVMTQGFDTDAWDSSGTAYPNYNPSGGGYIPITVNSWQFIEHEYDAANGNFDVWCNGQKVITYANLPERDVTGPVGLRPTLLGFDQAGGSIPADSRGGCQFIDSIVYHSGTYARIVLTDNATYSSSTKFENQMMDSCDGKTQNFVMNRGEITSGGYLHFFDSNGSILKVQAA